MTSYILRILIFVAIQMAFLPAVAQWGDVRFSTFGSAQGLSQNTVQCLLEDDIGFVWIGTRDGLNRYDSYQFLMFKQGQGQSLPSSDIKAIAQDRDKLIWVATGDGAPMTTINPVTEEVQRADRFTDGTFTLSDVMQISPTRNGDLLFASRSSGLSRYRHLNKKIDRTSFEHAATFALEDRSNNVWITGEDGKIYYVSANGKILRTYLLSEGSPGAAENVYLTSLFIDSRDNVWVGTYGQGLYKLNKSADHFDKVRGHERYDSLRYIMAIEEDIFGKLWIGTDGEGLLIFDEYNNTIQAYKEDQRDAYSLADNSITSIRRDRKGNMWIGTSKAGFSLVNIEQVNHLHYRNTSEAYSINNNIVNCIYEDLVHNIWIGTDGGGINIFDKASGRFYNRNNTNYLRFLSKEASVLSLTEDSMGNIWIGTWKEGLYKFDPKSKQSKHFHSGNLSFLKTNSVTAMVYTQGILIFGTYGDGLLLYDSNKDKWTVYHSTDDSPLISSNHILCLSKTADGQILVGTEGGGLTILSVGDNAIQRFATNTPLQGDALSHNSILSIEQDRKGYIWLGTPNGLNKLDIKNNHNEVFYDVGYEHSSSLVNIVLEDAFGNIWATTNKGLSKIHPNTHTIHYYSTSLGLQTSEFRKAKLRSQDKLLYFGSNDGLHVINPHQVITRPHQSNLVLTSFVLNNKEVMHQSITYSKRIKINYDYNVFNITFANLDFVDPEVKRYAYMIVGQNKDWQPLGSKNYLSFVRMSPGNYVLKLRTTDSQGDWSPQITTLHIEIVPPFWSSWWFRLLLFVIFAVTVFFLFYRRTKRIHYKNKILAQKVAEKTLEITQQQSLILQQNKDLEHVVSELKASNTMKDKFFSILAHDLRNPLTVMTNVSDFLYDKFRTIPSEELAQHLDDFRYSTKSIHNLLVNLLEWGKSKTGIQSVPLVSFNLYDLVQKVIYLFKLPLQEKRIQVHVDIDANTNITAEYQMIYTVLRNIIGNCIKFTHDGGYIHVRCEIKEMVEIGISDSGIGMTAQQISDILEQNVQHTQGTHGETGTGLGFQICQELIKAHNGKFRIASTPGKGTQFSISLPLTHQQEIKDGLPIPFNEQVDLAELEKHAGKTILVVDDNAEIRKILQLLLGGLFHVEQAENGRVGLEHAKRLQPDLVITDLIMPEMDGFTFIKMMKADLVTSHIPVLMLTGEQDDEQQIMSYKSGVDVFLKKPFNKKLLYAVIGKFLDDQKYKQLLLASGNEPVPTGLAPVDEEFLNDIKTFILQHIDDYNMSDKSICQHFGISRSILYAKFKTLTGQSVHDFIKNIRIEEAVKLLHEGRMNVSQIAYAVGFNSISYFSRSFTKKMGQSPKEFQKKS